MKIKPTGNVKIDRLSQELRVCVFESQPSHTKDLKHGDRYTQLSVNLESDIDKPERRLSSL